MNSHACGPANGWQVVGEYSGEVSDEFQPEDPKSAGTSNSSSGSSIPPRQLSDEFSIRRTTALQAARDATSAERDREIVGLSYRVSIYRFLKARRLTLSGWGDVVERVGEK